MRLVTTALDVAASLIAVASVAVWSIPAAGLIAAAALLFVSWRLTSVTDEPTE